VPQQAETFIARVVVDASMLFVGVDPGKRGAIAVIDYQSTVVSVLNLDGATDRDTFAFFEDLDERFGAVPRRAVIEKVASSPQMGVKSAFAFGRSYGFLNGLLTGTKTYYELHSPQKWQAAMGCLSRGDKNVTKAAAQRLWPSWKITHANADALLISEFCRRQWRSAR
jgi:hypothetical protein